MRSAPACSASATCSPRRAKSAERIDGASFTAPLPISKFLVLQLSGRSRDARSVIRLRSTAVISCLVSGRLEDALNRFIQQSVVLGLGLLDRQPLYQRPRKARHDAVIPTQAVVAFFS